MCRRIGIAVLSAALSAVSAFSQSAASNNAKQPDQPREVIANGGLLHTLLAAPVTSQPYSAVQVQRVVRTLADGTTIKNGPGPGHVVMRDSLGRVWIEHRLTRATANDPGIFMVFVLDPVDHTMTFWSTSEKGEKVATLVRLPAARPQSQPVSGSPQASAETNRPQPIVSTENLGTDILEGVSVDVVKTTTIVPVGRAGNDAPITRTHEVWTSPDLKLTMKEEWNDPRTGDRTVQLTKFSRIEPEASMFRPPAGYKVKDLKETLREAAEKLAEMPTD